MTQQMNQFTQAPLKGDLALLVNPSTFSVQLDAASLETYILPGAGLKLVSATSDQIVVDKAALTDNVFAFVKYSAKKEKFYPGDTLECCSGFSVMFLEASGSITRGDQVEFVPTGDKVRTGTGNPVCGLALGNAATTELVPVMILQAITMPATITSGSINGTPIGGSTPAAGAFTTLSSSGTTTLGDAAGDSIVITGIVDLTASTIKGATPFVFEGATADAFETSLAITDPTADRTITIPDASGTVGLFAAAALVLTPSGTISWASAKAQALATLVPDQTATINAVVTDLQIGKEYVLEVTTSGTSSFTLTFGTNFKSTGTLATGTADAKKFVVAFVFNGTSLVEKSRTTAM